tara:strand:- start:572 stop:781 length:210 start_codon:yes stop_codon:yes gene_type:complete
MKPTYLHYTFRVRIDHKADLAEALEAGQQAMDTVATALEMHCIGVESSTEEIEQSLTVEARDLPHGGDA